MGNTMGKKRKLGSAASAKWAPEVHAKKDGMSPLGRSYSMPVHHAHPKADNYHVVALTSSTYGILKVDLPKDADQSRTTTTTTMSQSRPTATKKPQQHQPQQENYSSFTFQEKLRKLDIPEIVVPQPWSDVGQIISKFKSAEAEAKAVAVPTPPPALKAVREDEPETINMWELMAGLDDDARSPFVANESPAKPAAAGVRKVRNLETSLSCSVIHSVTEVDSDFLDEAAKSELRSSSAASSAERCAQRPSDSPAAVGPPLRKGRENGPSAPGGRGDDAFSSSGNSARPLNSDVEDSNGGDGRVDRPALVPDESAAMRTPAASVGGRPFVRISSGGTNSRSNSSSSVSSAGATIGQAAPGSSLPSQGRGGKHAGSSPFGFTTSSSSDDSEDQFVPDSPLFDPELLASFEKAIEDVSEDEWYRVRRSDAGVTSTSGSSSDDGDSPVTAGAAAGTAAALPSKTNNSSGANQPKAVNGVVESPAARSRRAEAEVGAKRMSSKVAPVDFRDVVLQKVVRKPADPFEKFEKMCPPGGEERVVIYVTSLRGIRKTFEDCSHMKLVVQGYRVAVDERDVSMHADFRQELKDLLGKPMPVPRLFIRGRYIGGAEEMSLLHEDGTLAKLLATMPTQTSWEQCDGCGDHRFVPCSECSGSCKIVSDDGQVTRCTDCNENGLMRCPICY